MKDSYEEQLGRLVDVHVNEILNATDEQILAEAAEDFGDVATAIEHVVTLIRRATMADETVEECAGFGCSVTTEAKAPKLHERDCIETIIWHLERDEERRREDTKRRLDQLRAIAGLPTTNPAPEP